MVLNEDSFHSLKVGDELRWVGKNPRSLVVVVKIPKTFNSKKPFYYCCSEKENKREWPWYVCYYPYDVWEWVTPPVNTWWDIWDDSNRG